MEKHRINFTSRGKLKRQAGNDLLFPPDFINFLKTADNVTLRADRINTTADQTFIQIQT